MFSAYFRGADLATAFAATLAMNKIGPIVSSFTRSQKCLYEVHCDPKVFFWGGTAITLLSVIAGIAFCVLDRRAEGKKVVVSASKKSHKFSWKDLKDFSVLYWVLCAICGCYYISIFTLMVVFPDLANATTYSQLFSNWIYLIAILCTPIFSRLIDNFGKRIIVLAVSVAIMLPLEPILSLAKWDHGGWFMFAAGASYSAVASTLLPCICMVVRDDAIGIANGIATAIQMVCFGIVELTVKPLVYDILNSAPVFLMGCCTMLGVVLSILANIMDKKRFGGLFNNFRPLKEKREETENINIHSDNNEEEAEEDNDQSKPLLKA